MQVSFAYLGLVACPHISGMETHTTKSLGWSDTPTKDGGSISHVLYQIKAVACDQTSARCLVQRHGGGTAPHLSWLRCILTLRSGCGVPPSQDLTLFDPMLPPTFGSGPGGGPQNVGPQHGGTFTSEFGATSFPSFESITPSLGPEKDGLWGLHSEPFVQRNHPADSFIGSYFGIHERDSMNSTGAAVLQRHLYQSMLAQALNIKSIVETMRSANKFGALTWQLGEVWPTGGWGVVEYGAVFFLVFGV